MTQRISIEMRLNLSFALTLIQQARPCVSIDDATLYAHTAAKHAPW